MNVAAKEPFFGARTFREIQQLAQSAVQAMVDFVYPPRCLVCGRPPGESSLRVCKSCFDSIPRHADALGQLELARPHGPQKTLPYIAVWDYEEPLRTIIHAMKYQGMWKVAVQLGDEIAAEIRSRDDFANADLLVPVPLHRVRGRERGYNQSQKLAEGISKITQQRVLPALARTRNTRTQTTLSLAERQANVREAFTVRSGQLLAGSRVVLVDDVLTTGATVEACATALMAAGVTEVRVAVAARPSIRS